MPVKYAIIFKLIIILLLPCIISGCKLRRAEKVNSTFAFYPGVPVFKSRDLVSWQQIGHVPDRPGQLNPDGLDISEGIFAPAIRYHDGTFYMITTLVGGGGNFLVTAEKPEGLWANPICLPDVTGIDPSLFTDTIILLRQKGALALTIPRWYSDLTVLQVLIRAMTKIRCFYMK